MKRHTRIAALAACVAAASVAALPSGCADGTGTPGTRPGDERAIDEWLDSGYNAFVPPGGLVALDRAADRFIVEISRRERSAALDELHLALTIRRDGAVLCRGEHRARLTGGQHASLRVEAPLSVWTIIRNGRLAAVLRAWEYNGFDLEAVVREGGTDGPLVYRLHDPGYAVRVSRSGFFDRHGLALGLAGLGLALLACLAACRGGRRSEWRATLVFDIVVLAAVAALAGAFTRYLLLSWWAAAFILPLMPARIRRWSVEATAAFVRIVRGRGPMRSLIAWSPAAATAALTAWLLAWHLALLIAMGFRPSDFGEHLRLLSALYLAVSLVLVTQVHGSLARRAANGHAMWPPLGAAALVAALLVAVRALDWGTFFFSAGHVDEDFWTHAFHGQVVGLAADRTVGLVMAGAAVSAALAALLLWRAAGFARWWGAWPEPKGGLSLRAVLRANAAAAVLAIVLAGWTWPVVAPAARRDISNSIREAFAGIPELKVSASLMRVLAPRRAGRMPALDEAFVRKLGQAGVRLHSMDPAWPLMKPSIYLDPASAARAGRPRVPAGTNVIVILCESLSAALVDEAVHGLAGLTPAIDDFRRSAFTFQRLYSADFPTIKGELAALASFAFDHGGLPITADTGNPLKSRYLFLSDVLRARGYSAYHLQSDFASFAGTASILARHSYEHVYAAESAELRRRARHPIEKTWGLYDEDLFAAVADLMDEDRFREPFLLTVATTDLHFPYATLRRHPATGGNALLDAVHSEDAAFAVFWNRFKGSRRASDTLVLLTADHALVRRFLRKGGAEPKRSAFDYVLGSLYVPGDPRWAGGGTDTTCTQLDLTPTLLDVLGIDTPNPFLGLSIFAERPRYPLALAREIPSERWTPGERAAVQGIGWTGADHRRWLDLLRYLAVTDRVLPPGPPGPVQPQSR